MSRGASPERFTPRIDDWKTKLTARADGSRRHWAAKIRDGVQEHIVPEAANTAKEIKEAALAEIRERIRARIHRIFAGGRRKRR